MEIVQCKTDKDYEKFAVFFLQNRNIFDDMYPILDTLGSLYVMIEETNLLLFQNIHEEVFVAASYTLGVREDQFKNKHIVFIDCALLKKEYQNTRSFVKGFLQMLKHILEEHPEVKEVQFYAYRHHGYIHRLYKKFATIIDEKEGYFGMQDVFSVEFYKLTTFLEEFNKKQTI